MVQLFLKTSFQLLQKAGKSSQFSKNSLRFLTQADFPQKSTKSKKPEIASEPESKKQDVSGSKKEDVASESGFGKNSFSNQEIFPKKAKNSNEKMTAAGILLPQDAVTEIDSSSKPEKKEKKFGVKNGISETDAKQNKENFSEKQQNFGKMKSWQISRFDDIAGLKLVEDTNVPVLSDPFDLLVEIHAASVNPFDIARTRGYGENLIEKLRDVSNFFPVPKVPNITNMFTRKEQPFPLTLGRDFSGVVVDTGKGVRGIRAGDEVFGVVGPHRQGTFAEFAATSNWCVAKKPTNISHAQAASIPYVACTAWSAMKLVQNLPNRNENTRVLVLGGSGGIGSFAIQYLKTLGVHVTTVCGTDGLDLVAELGADDVIDYKTADVENELDKREKFDVIFQASGKNYENLKKNLKGNFKSFFVTLDYPLLKNFDDHGSVAGLLKSGVDFSKEYLKNLKNGNHTIWAFFTPNGPFLEEISQLINQGKIRPVLGKTFSFKDLPSAFQQVDSGNTNGKIVVEIKK